MSNFIIIFGFTAAGLLLQNIKGFPVHIYKTLNKIVIYLCLPAMALYYIPKIKWSNELLFPIGAAWIGFAMAILLFSVLRKIYGWSNKLTGCLILTSGLGNTSFLGYPIIETLYGQKGLETAVLVDQPGTFVIVSTLGIFVAAFYSKGNPNTLYIMRKILSFPPFITFIIACFMNVTGYDFDTNLQFAFQKSGILVTPLALLSVGLQLRFEKNSSHWRFLTLGLFFKLIITPLFFLILYVFILKQNTPAIKVTIMETAMAPMITASILASTYGLKPRLSSMMIGFGIPVSFATLMIWYFIVGFI